LTGRPNQKGTEKLNPTKKGQPPKKGGKKQGEKKKKCGKMAPKGGGGVGSTPKKPPTRGVGTKTQQFGVWGVVGLKDNVKDQTKKRGVLGEKKNL